jgi:hypothetical protein
MDQITKIILALQQIENLIQLIEGNEYQKFLYGHLIFVQVELRRQLTNLCRTDNIKE